MAPRTSGPFAGWDLNTAGDVRQLADALRFVIARGDNNIQLYLNNVALAGLLDPQIASIRSIVRNMATNNVLAIFINTFVRDSVHRNGAAAPDYVGLAADLEAYVRPGIEIPGSAQYIASRAALIDHGLLADSRGTDAGRSGAAHTHDGDVNFPLMT